MTLSTLNKNDSSLDYSKGFDYWYAKFYQVAGHPAERMQTERKEIADFGEGVVDKLNAILPDIESEFGGSFIPPFNNKSNKSNKVIFEKKDHYFVFPSLVPEGEEWKNTEIRIDINPCIGGSPVTKIFVIPRYVGDYDISELADFYERAERIAGEVLDSIAKHYFNILSAMQHEYENLLSAYDFDDREEYVLMAHTIGGHSGDFTQLIKSADDIKRLRKITNDSDDIKEVFNGIIPMLIKTTGYTKDIVDYEWFLRSAWESDTNVKSDGFVGFYGDDKRGHFLGITDGNPHAFARSLMLKVLRNL